MHNQYMLCFLFSNIKFYRCTHSFAKRTELHLFASLAHSSGKLLNYLMRQWEKKRRTKRIWSIWSLDCNGVWCKFKRHRLPIDRYIYIESDESSYITVKRAFTNPTSMQHPFENQDASYILALWDISIWNVLFKPYENYTLSNSICNGFCTLNKLTHIRFRHRIVITCSIVLYVSVSRSLFRLMSIFDEMTLWKVLHWHHQTDGSEVDLATNYGRWKLCVPNVYANRQWHL